MWEREQEPESEALHSDPGLPLGRVSMPLLLSEM